jgi:hypothetical protein
MFCILLAMSRVATAVEPPAPQVMSQKVGPYDAIRSCLSNKFSNPWTRQGITSHTVVCLQPS